MKVLVVASARTLQLLKYDNEDQGLITSRKWSINSAGYARTSTDSAINKEVFLHRIIMKPTLGFEVDHIDGDRLNDTRTNLRIVTCSLNAFARYHPNGMNSPLRGVFRRSNKYRAQIVVNRTSIYLGMYDTPEEAHEVYKMACLKYFGELPTR